MIWPNLRAIMAIVLSALLMIAAASYQPGQWIDRPTGGQVAVKLHLPH
jgi:hypothetical protein